MSELREQILTVANKVSGQIGTFRATSVEGLKRLYYSYNLHQKFGILPKYLENVDSFEIFGYLCFYLANSSSVLYDFADSVHLLVQSKEENYTKLFDITKKFYRTNQISYAENYNDYFSTVFSYFLDELFVASLSMYISYLKGKAALLYRDTFLNITKSIDNNSTDYQEIKSFLEKIKNKFISFFSVSNEELVTVFDNFNFKNHIQRALATSTTLNLTDLYKIKQNLDENIYNLYVEKIDEVFNSNSSNSFYFYLITNNVLPTGVLDNYMEYMNNTIKQL